MENSFEELFQEAILLEENSSNLYNLFSKLYAQDSKFWLKLYEEEKQHYLLLKYSKDFIIDVFPKDISFEKGIRLIKNKNKAILNEMEIYSKNPPNILDAYEFSLNTESFVMNYYFEIFISKTKFDTEKIRNIFEKINHDESDHFNRIILFISENIINVKSNLKTLLSIAIKLENLAKKIYEKLIVKFKNNIEIYNFFEMMRQEEIQHKKTLERIKENVKNIEEEEEFDLEKLSECYINLLQVYYRDIDLEINILSILNIVHNLESSEINSIYTYLISKYLTSDEKKEILLNQLSDHYKRVIEFSERYDLLF